VAGCPGACVRRAAAGGAHLVGGLEGDEAVGQVVEAFGLQVGQGAGAPAPRWCTATLSVSTRSAARAIAPSGSAAICRTPTPAGRPRARPPRRRGSGGGCRDAARRPGTPRRGRRDRCPGPRHEVVGAEGEVIDAPGPGPHHGHRRGRSIMMPSGIFGQCSRPLAVEFLAGLGERVEHQVERLGLRDVRTSSRAGPQAEARRMART